MAQALGAYPNTYLLVKSEESGLNRLVLRTDIGNVNDSELNQRFPQAALQYACSVAVSRLLLLQTGEAIHPGSNPR